MLVTPLFTHSPGPSNPCPVLHCFALFSCTLLFSSLLCSCLIHAVDDELCSMTQFIVSYRIVSYRTVQCSVVLSFMAPCCAESHRILLYYVSDHGDNKCLKVKHITSCSALPCETLPCPAVLCYALCCVHTHLYFYPYLYHYLYFYIYLHCMIVRMPLKSPILYGKFLPGHRINMKDGCIFKSMDSCITSSGEKSSACTRSKSTLCVWLY